MITGKVKNSLIRAVTLIAVLSMVFTMVACNKDNEESPERYGEGTSDVEISGFDYGFIEEANYEDRVTTVADTKRSLPLRVDTVYFCMIEFDVIARDLNDGTSLLDILIKFDNLGVTEGTTEEAGTGNTTEIKFKNAETGTESKISTLSYKIPSDPDKSKKIKILVRMIPMSVGESHISVSFESNEANEFKVLGDDGVTKNIKIDRVALETPVITVEQNKVKWKHVKNAAYYTIYFGEEQMNFEVPSNTSVGTDIEFNLSKFLIELGVDFGEVKVEANPGGNTNFSKSALSNIVYDVTIY